MMDLLGSALANSLDISTATVSRYLDLLEGGFLVHRLPPWFSNVGKRLGRGFYKCIADLKPEKKYVIVPVGDAYFKMRGLE